MDIVTDLKLEETIDIKQELEDKSFELLNTSYQSDQAIKIKTEVIKEEPQLYIEKIEEDSDSISCENLSSIVHAREYLRLFSLYLKSYPRLANAMDVVVGADLMKEIDINAVGSILKRYEQPMFDNLDFKSSKTFLESISLLLVDKTAIEVLVSLFEGAVWGNFPGVNDSHPCTSTAFKIGFKLLLILVLLNPKHFQDQKILERLINLIRFKNPSSTLAILSILSILTYVGRHKPIGEQFPSTKKTLIPLCCSFALTGLVNKAKLSVLCLYVNFPNERESTFSDIFEKLHQHLTFKSPFFRTAVVSLGHIALLMSEQFSAPLKGIISKKIVKELLIRNSTMDHTPGNFLSSSEENLKAWPKEKSQLSEESLIKAAGIKMMVRWLLGLKCDLVSTRKTLRILTAFIQHKGDLLQTNKMRKSDMAFLRLTAGVAMLKICRQKELENQLTTEQFYVLSHLMVDECHHVRREFVAKLHKGLSIGFPDNTLPLDFMAYYALAGLEPDERLKNVVKICLVADIEKRDTYTRLLKHSHQENSSLPRLERIMPNYLITFAVPLLAHLPGLKKLNNVVPLMRIKECMWFILQPLMTQQNSYCAEFYKALIHAMKNHCDALSPRDMVANRRLWAVCELAMGLIMSKNIKGQVPFFGEIVIPPMFFSKPKGTEAANGAAPLDPIEVNSCIPPPMFLSQIGTGPAPVPESVCVQEDDPDSVITSDITIPQESGLVGANSVTVSTEVSLPDPPIPPSLFPLPSVPSSPPSPFLVSSSPPSMTPLIPPSTPPIPPLLTPSSQPLQFPPSLSAPSSDPPRSTPASQSPPSFHSSVSGSFSSSSSLSNPPSSASIGLKTIRTLLMEQKAVLKGKNGTASSVPLNKVKRRVKLRNRSRVEFLHCSECNYRTTNKGALMIHSLLHPCIKNNFWRLMGSNLRTPKGLKNLDCPVCDFKTHRNNALEIHLLEHKKGGDNFHCSKCDFQTSEVEAFKQHLMDHLPFKTFRCFNCPFRTNVRKNFRKHLMNHCPNSLPFVAKKFKCPWCDFKTHWKGLLNRHIRIHPLRHNKNSRYLMPSLNSKKFTCSECPFKTNSIRTLKFHSLSHLTIQTLTCSECHYRVDNKKELDFHLLSHSKEDRDPTLPQSLRL